MILKGQPQVLRNRYDCRQTSRTEFDLFVMSILNGAFKISDIPFPIAGSGPTNLTTPDAFPIFQTHFAESIALRPTERFSVEHDR